VFKFLYFVKGIGFTMTNDISLHHVGIECSGQQSAHRFFTSILGFSKIKSKVISKELSASIFGIDKEVPIDVYENGKMRVEVFMIKSRKESTYQHLCFEVEDKDKFLVVCKQHGLSPFFVENEGKQLLFVRDFSNNLYEIK
jgi:catechol 2,3-dioxygenase-like lactoylglutathione lyase family enzyme